MLSHAHAFCIMRLHHLLNRRRAKLAGFCFHFLRQQTNLSSVYRFACASSGEFNQENIGHDRVPAFVDDSGKFHLHFFRYGIYFMSVSSQMESTYDVLLFAGFVSSNNALSSGHITIMTSSDSVTYMANSNPPNGTAVSAIPVAKVYPQPQISVS